MHNKCYRVILRLFGSREKCRKCHDFFPQKSHLECRSRRARTGTEVIGAGFRFNSPKIWIPAMHFVMQQAQESAQVRSLLSIRTINWASIQHCACSSAC